MTFDRRAVLHCVEGYIAQKEAVPPPRTTVHVGMSTIQGLLETKDTHRLRNLR